MEHQNRRAALVSLAGVAIAGSALGLAACHKGGDDDKQKEGEAEVTANEDLMREHGVLRRILIIYREVSPKLLANAASVDAAALARAANLFRQFGERYHQQLLEEQHIFTCAKGGR